MLRLWQKVHLPTIIIVQYQGTSIHFSMELTQTQTNYCMFSYQFIKIIFNSYIITTSAYLHEVFPVYCHTVLWSVDVSDLNWSVLFC